MDLRRFYLDLAKVCADTARVSGRAEYRAELERERATWLTLADDLDRPQPQRRRVLLRRS